METIGKSFSHGFMEQFYETCKTTGRHFGEIISKAENDEHTDPTSALRSAPTETVPSVDCAGIEQSFQRRSVGPPLSSIVAENLLI